MQFRSLGYRFINKLQEVYFLVKDDIINDKAYTRKKNTYIKIELIKFQ